MGFIADRHGEKAVELRGKALDLPVNRDPESTGRVTYLIWPGKASGSQKEKGCLGEGCLEYLGLLTPQSDPV